MIKIISRLPLWALYAFSGFLYVLAYYVVRHRHRVIREQIALVFPGESEAERVAIHKRYLKNFCDVLVEVLKSASMSGNDLSARVPIDNLAVARQFLMTGQSVLLVTSHLYNWEWLLHGIALQLGYPLDAAYKPLHDPWAERLMLGIRSRFGARLIPAKELLTDFLRRRAVVRAVAMNADQAPVSTETRYWTTFLGRDTAFYVGAEQIARATRLPVLYVAMRRVRRGRYAVAFEPDFDDTAPRGSLESGHLRLAEARGPVGRERAVGGAGDRVFVDSRGRREEAGYEIEFSGFSGAARSHDDAAYW